MNPDSNSTYGDAEGSRMCSEICLLLAVQRGKLSLILDWVATCLGGRVQEPSASFSIKVLKTCLDQMRKVTGIKAKNDVFLSSSDDGSEESEDDGIAIEALNDEMVQYDAAFVILRQLMAHASSNLVCEPDGKNSGTGDGNFEAYCWGSNSSHQLAEGSKEKILLPKLSSQFGKPQCIEAGQFCTFLLDSDSGNVSGCGKGSYGRLGVGDSNNQAKPKPVPIPNTVKLLSSSKGGDGHTLALTVDGVVFSWGDGELDGVAV